MPSGLLVTKTKLSVDVEAPGIKVAIFCEASSVAETCGAADNLMLHVGLCVEDWNLLRDPNLSLLTKTKLSHFCLSPTIKEAILGDREGVVSSSIN